MDLRRAEEIFLKIKPFTDHVYLHVKGEPLLHPEIDKILDLAYLHQIKVNITTNGVLIDTVKNKLLNKPALRQINFSLHSFDSDLKTFKDSNYFEDIFNFTEKVLTDSKTIVSFRLWNLDSDNKVNIAKAKNQKILRRIESKFALPTIVEELVPGRGVKICERLFLNLDSVFEWPDLTSNSENPNGFCYALRSHIAVLADGTVVPCCLDGEGILALGNIFLEDFGEIISNNRSKAIYDGFSETKAIENLCKKCSFKGKFE
jgi:radical SAM protein with 4Fe4S-binding SPASM domain